MNSACRFGPVPPAKHPACGVVSLRPSAATCTPALACAASTADFCARRLAGIIGPTLGGLSFPLTPRPSHTTQGDTGPPPDDTAPGDAGTDDQEPREQEM